MTSDSKSLKCYSAFRFHSKTLQNTDNWMRFIDIVRDLIFESPVVSLLLKYSELCSSYQYRSVLTTKT